MPAGSTARVPNNFANLGIGFKYFLDFAVESEAISPAESQALWDRAIAAFNTLADEQRSQEVQADPVHRYFELLRSALGDRQGAHRIAWMTGAVSDLTTSSDTQPTST